MKASTHKSKANYKNLILWVFVAVSFSLSAKASNSNPSLTILEEKTTAIEEATNIASEADYLLEEWMLNANEHNWSVVSEETVFEEEILIEEWMLNATDEFWSNNIVPDVEEELDVEDWMINMEEWNN